MEITYNPDKSVISFPGSGLLTFREACNYLGTASHLLKLMRFLRCGPPTVSIGGNTVYREDDLLWFRMKLMKDVGLSGLETVSRSAVTTRLYEKAHPGIDVLMTLLCKRYIRRKLILTTLWSLFVIGVVMNLILF
ncbi:hypothetical protein [Acetobacter fallax]|uniref:Uncharacterized protein n=1 Tax=Acetobacter fallax TaxID=1737473 RepID=A0ABX0K4Y0_9PROT|nr:hypothetical protein [Acetobacter fallax]NHO31381.1 hypothetical protein [Acetobacter fallax]NHO35037.1 hypothetical protein [Acetobacter fallax]